MVQNQRQGREVGAVVDAAHRVHKIALHAHTHRRGWVQLLHVVQATHQVVDARHAGSAQVGINAAAVIRALVGAHQHIAAGSPARRGVAHRPGAQTPARSVGVAQRLFALAKVVRVLAGEEGARYRRRLSLRHRANRRHQCAKEIRLHFVPQFFVRLTNSCR
ncbi:hypothetical protein D3C72_1609860 [compost metagenome]